MAANEVFIQPHRRSLVGTRLQEIQRTVRQQGLTGDSLGAAVAYRPSVGWVLIGGEHRWKATSTPADRTTVLVLGNWEDLVAWMAVDVTDPRRLSWDPVSAVAFYEKAVAALRPGRDAHPLRDVAEFTGIHRGILEGVRHANAVIADPDEAADVKAYTQGLLDDLERGAEGGHSTRDRISRFRAKRSAAARPPQSVAAQRKALESIAQLEGIVAALGDIGPLNPDLPEEEREGYAARLGRLSAPLTRIKRALRGETE